MSFLVAYIASVSGLSKMYVFLSYCFLSPLPNSTFSSFPLKSLFLILCSEIKYSSCALTACSVSSNSIKAYELLLPGLVFTIVSFIFPKMEKIFSNSALISSEVYCFKIVFTLESMLVMKSLLPLGILSASLLPLGGLECLFLLASLDLLLPLGLGLELLLRLSLLLLRFYFF